MSGIPRRRWWEAFGLWRSGVGVAAAIALFVGAGWYPHPFGITLVVAALVCGVFVVLRPAVRHAEFGLAASARDTIDTYVANLTDELAANREEIETCAQLLADDAQQAAEWVHDVWARTIESWRGPGGSELRTYLLGQLVAITLAKGGATDTARSDPGREPGVLAYLPPVQRAAFVLCRMAHFELDEAAPLLKLSPDQVAVELRAAEEAVMAVEGT